MTLPVANLHEALEGSTWLILLGVDPEDWAVGFTGMLQEEGIGTPKAWFKATGQQMNDFLWPGSDPRDKEHDYFPVDAGFALCPLDGLNVSKLALFRMKFDPTVVKWFDDFVANQRGR